VQAAEERDIPWRRLNEGALIQLGQGRHQKRIEAALTSSTPHTAVEIAADKTLTHRLLAGLGLPVPRQELAGDAEEAVAAAGRLGYPWWSSRRTAITAGGSRPASWDPTRCGRPTCGPPPSAPHG